MIPTTFRPNKLAAAISVVLLCAGTGAHAATCTATDRASLETCISGADDTISITSGITLDQELPLIDRGVTIEGNGNMVSGNNLYRVFFVKSGTVIIQNMTIANGKALGGAGGKKGGGGGAGLGGGLFVYDGTVNVNSVSFTNNNATGGNGGDDSGSFYSGGGGGMGGNGGDSAGSNAGEKYGGGGGLLTTDDSTGVNGAGSGAGSYGNPNGGAGGFGAGGGGGYDNGGTSSFGGGGGAGSATGAMGGFGGGGGGSYTSGGSGGFGGGGGGVKSGATPGTGGEYGGNGDTGYCGGGGGGIGGAIFVRQGTTTLTNVTFGTGGSANTTVAGNSGCGGATVGTTAGNDVFICTTAKCPGTASNPVVEQCGTTASSSVSGGSFSTCTSNSAPTTGTVTANDVSQANAGQSSYIFTVEYTDSDDGVDVSTITTGDVTVNNSASIAGATEASGSDGSPKTAIYAITPPGGTWDDSDNGTYTIALAGSEVCDTNASPACVAANASLATFNVSMDTTAPGAPSTPDMTTASDSGSSNSDDITNDTTPTFQGTAEANVTVELFRGGSTSLGTTTAGVGGNWTLTAPTLPAGAHTITAKATDAAGNISVASSGLGISIDTTAPAAPAVTGISNDNGSSGADQITNDATLVFSGTAVANSSVEVFIGGGSIGTTTAGGGGAWSYDHTGTTLAEGSHSVTAKATDTAGNTSAASSALAVTVDTTSPIAAYFARATPTEEETNANSLIFRAAFSEAVSGVDTGDFALSGSTGSATNVTPDNPSAYYVTVSGGDLASFNGVVGLNLSSPSIEDLAGNPLPNSEPSTDQTYTLDHTLPTVDSIVRADSNPTNATSVGFTVTFSEAVTGVATGDFVLDQTGLTGASISAVSGSGTTYTVSVNTGTGDGTVSIDFDADAAGGASDAAGNVTTADWTTGETYTIDKTAPNVIITEILKDSAAVLNADGEWFEIYNAEASPVDIQGWTIKDNDVDSHVIASSVVVPAGSHVVLARNATFATNGGVTAAYQYAGILLGNNDDELILLDNAGNEVDRVEYDAGTNFPNPAGKSLKLNNLVADNNVGSNWSESICAFGDGDRGTPGAANVCIPTIEFSQATAYTAAENVGTSNALTLTRGGDTSGTSSVQVSITGGGATGSGTDYTSAGFPKTISFAATETSKTVDVAITDDTLYEPSAAETITFSIASPTNSVLGSQTTATLNITDNDSAPTAQFSSASQSGSENAGAMTVDVNLSNPSTQVISVPFTPTGTATGGGTDYTLTASPLSFAAGETAKTITITPVNETEFETNETVILTLGSPTNATASGTTVHTATINNDDSAPTASFTSASQSGAENGGALSITAQLTNKSHQTVSVPFTLGGSATGGGTDYTIAASPITIAAGTTSADITLTPVDDSLHEFSETVVITMGSPTNATASGTTVHTVTISDNDTAPTVAFTAATSTQTESTASATITAQLSAVAGVDVIVPFTINGTSTATGSGTDYSLSPASSLTIPKGSTTADLTITLNNDSVDEPDETVVVDMTTGSLVNATAGATTSHTLTIQDDDASLVINELDYDQGGSDNAEFIELKNISGGAMDLGAGNYELKLMDSTGVTVLRTIDLTGSVANNDYFVVCDTTAKVLNCDQALGVGNGFIHDSGPIAVALMQGSFVVDTVSYEGDTGNGFTETASAPTDTGAEALVGLSRTTDGGDTGDNSADFGLRCVTPGAANNLAASSNCFQISINDPTAVTEGNSGTTSLDFTVSLSHAASANVTVDYATADNTAIAGSDYTAKTGTVIFPAGGNASQTVSIDVTGDQIDEAAETFVVNLSNPSVNAVISDNQGTGAITDDDTAGVTLGKTTASVNESGTTDTFTVVLDSQPASNVELSVVSGDTGEATVSATPSLPLIFTPVNWNVARTVTVTGVDDLLADTDQTTNLLVSVVDANSDDQYDPVANQTVVVTTVDNDVPGFTVSTASLTVAEPSGSDTFTLKLNTAPTGDVVVPLSATGGCSVGAASATLTTGNWNTGVTVTVTAVDDAIDNNPDRVCAVTTGDPTSGADATYDAKGAGDVADVSVTVTDNDTASATVTPTSGLIAVEGGADATFSVTLATEPAADVTIGLTPSSAECTASAAGPLTSANHIAGVTVTVTATNDSVVDGDLTCTIATAFTSGDAVYAAINPDDVTVTAQDNDTAGVSIGATSATTEGGATTTYTVTLDTEPSSGNVIVTATPSTAQCSVTGSPLTLSDTTPGIITVTATDDADVEGNHNCTISHAVTSGPADYPTSMSIADATVSLEDNDAGVILRHTGGSTTVAEGGATDTFEVLLSTNASVDVTLTPDTEIDLGSGVGTAHVLSFTAGNSGQAVTVTANDDSAVEGAHTGGITLTSLSATASYNPAQFVVDGANATPVTTFNVAIGDNDAPPPPVATPAEIKVSWNGAEIPLGAPATDFGVTEIGQVARQNFLVENLGGSDLRLSSFAVTTGSGFSVTPLSGPMTLSPGSTLTLSAQLDATQAGDFTATARLTNNDGDESEYDLALIGTVNQPVTTPPVTPPTPPVTPTPTPSPVPGGIAILSASNVTSATGQTIQWPTHQTLMVNEFGNLGTRGDNQSMITLRRTVASGATASAVGVELTVSGQVSASDYTLAPRQVTWSAGDTRDQAVTLTLINDTEVENPETLTVTLTNPSGGATLGGAPLSFSVLSDDEEAPPVASGGGSGGGPVGAPVGGGATNDPVTQQDPEPWELLPLGGNGLQEPTTPSGTPPLAGSDGAPVTETSPAWFDGAASGPSGNRQTDFPRNADVHLQGFIAPSSDQRGQPAELYAWVEYGMNGQSFWYQRDENGHWQTWNQDVASLVPTAHQQHLPSLETLELYQGHLDIPGVFRVHIGFRLNSGDQAIAPIHFNKTPTTFFVGNSRGRVVRSGFGDQSHFETRLKLLDRGISGDGLEASQQETLEVSFTVRPQSRHRDRPASLKIWVERLINGQTLHYYRDGSFWRGSSFAPNPLELPSAGAIQLRENGNDIAIYTGALPDLAGHYTVHAGYQLEDGTFLETSEPLRFTIR